MEQNGSLIKALSDLDNLAQKMCQIIKMSGEVEQQLFSIQKSLYQNAEKEGMTGNE